MSRENNLSKGLLIGFLTGGIVGAAIALLYAPKSGKELRQDIKVKADELRDDAEKYIDSAKDKAVDLYNEGKKKSEKLVADAKVKADELIKDAEKVYSDAKHKATDAINTGKETLASESSRLKHAVKAGVDAYKETKDS
ncbi:MAG: YtxH domain-containing protein [Ignavibacteriaceae bacterium]